MNAVAKAFANNDVSLVVWSYSDKLAGCLGFCLERLEVGGTDPAAAWQPVPTWVGFPGQKNDSWSSRASDVWPIQKFSWRDLTADRGKSYRYRITPVNGPADAAGRLKRIDEDSLTTGVVTLTEKRGIFDAYFNRGILSTQFLSHAVAAGPSGAPNYQILDRRIDQPGDPLRNSLAGQLLSGVEALLEQATRDGGSCYLALYELTDPELIGLLLQATNLNVILSNTAPDDTENAPARQSLHEHAEHAPGWQVIDRFVPSGHIGHNKFCIYADAAGEPQRVLLGSTNWTDTALCAQSNNALIVTDKTIARAYLDYWNRLKSDTQADGRGPQGVALRTANQAPGVRDLVVDGCEATVWFSPNTARPRSSVAHTSEATPPDLAEVFELMKAAKSAILFLEFQPGHPSVIDVAAQIGNARPDLFIRGAVTDPGAVNAFNTILVHRPSDAPVEVVAAAAIDDQFGSFMKELLKSGPRAHAIIHDKIVVIDPLSDDCVVVTGSHNQGFAASYDNDENLMIVRGHRALAEAYAVHVMDIYDHYRFRYWLQTNGTAAYSGLSADDTWQDKYFAKAGANQDAVLWLDGVA